jgi:hypothetical protein
MKNVKKTKKSDPKTKVTNCTFIGVQYGGESFEAVLSVARALENLSRLFVAQNVQIESLLQIGAKEEVKT